MLKSFPLVQVPKSLGFLGSQYISGRFYGCPIFSLLLILFCVSYKELSFLTEAPIMWIGLILKLKVSSMSYKAINLVVDNHQFMTMVHITLHFAKKSVLLMYLD